MRSGSREESFDTLRDDNRTHRCTRVHDWACSRVGKVCSVLCLPAALCLLKMPRQPYPQPACHTQPPLAPQELKDLIQRHGSAHAMPTCGWPPPAAAGSCGRCPPSRAGRRCCPPVRSRSPHRLRHAGCRRPRGRRCRRARHLERAGPRVQGNLQQGESTWATCMLGLAAGADTHRIHMMPRWQVHYRQARPCSQTPSKACHSRYKQANPPARYSATCCSGRFTSCRSCW